eukprot:403356101
MQFGIDNQYWQTGPNFKGIKLIPPGAHYVYYALQDEEFAARMGFFIFINEAQEIRDSQQEESIDSEIYYTKQDVIVRKWNSERQEFEKVQDQQEEISYQEGVRNMDFDKYLGVYPMQNFQQWQGLSSFISKEVIDRIESVNSNHTILSEENERKNRIQEDQQKSSPQIPQDKQENQQQKVEEMDPDQDLENTIQAIQKELEQEEKRQQKAREKEYKYKEAYGNLYYTHIPQRKIVQGLTGSALTEANFDKSMILNDLLYKEYNQNSNLLLGELQFAFVTFLLGENLDSYEQWKRMISMLTTCDQALTQSDQMTQDLFYKFIPIVYEQTRQLPKDFFQAELSKQNFINDCMRQFIKICEEQPAVVVQEEDQQIQTTNVVSTLYDQTSGGVSKRIKQRVAKLKQMLVEEYGFKPFMSLEDRLMQQMKLNEEKDIRSNRTNNNQDENQMQIDSLNGSIQTKNHVKVDAKQMRDMLIQGMKMKKDNDGDDDDEEFDEDELPVILDEHEQFIDLS